MITNATSTAALPALPPGPPGYQPQPNLYVGMHRAGLFKDNLQLSIDFEQGEPVRFWEGHFQGKYTPYAQANERQRHAIGQAIEAARLLADAGHPAYFDRPHRDPVWEARFKEGEYMIVLEHWPGAPTSERRIAGNMKHLASAPPAVAAAVKALQQVK